MELHTWLPQRAQDICAQYGGSCDFQVLKGHPVLLSDPALTARVRAAAEALVGPENVVDMALRMGSEDFAFYAQKVPGVYCFVGNGDTPNVHHPMYVFDQKNLPVGAAYWVAVAEAYLK